MKILIIKTSALGDVVHVFPAVKGLKEHFPESAIDWVVEKSAAPLVLAHPLIRKTHTIETKKWRKSPFSYYNEIKRVLGELRATEYDLIFDFQGNVKSGIIMGLAKGKVKVGFGREAVSEFPNLFFSNHKVNPPPGLNIRQDYLSLVEGYLGKKITPSTTLLNLTPEEQASLEKLIAEKRSKNILVSPGSKWSNKKLPLATLAHRLQEIEAKYWIIQSSPEEKKEAETLKQHLSDACVMEAISLPLLQHWMRQMDLVISMDSLPLHLAGEAGVSTYSFFGPSLAEKYRPLGPNHQSIQGRCPYNFKFAKRCPRLRSCPTGACIKELSSLEPVQYL